MDSKTARQRFRLLAVLSINLDIVRNVRKIRIEGIHCRAICAFVSSRKARLCRIYNRKLKAHRFSYLCAFSHIRITL